MQRVMKAIEWLATNVKLNIKSYLKFPGVNLKTKYNKFYKWGLSPVSVFKSSFIVSPSIYFTLYGFLFANS
jgi:hypothetical protein